MPRPDTIATATRQEVQPTVLTMRNDPFRQLDRLTEQFFGARWRASAMPMDVYRYDDRVVVHLDVPGVDPSSIDLTAEKDVITVTAERPAPSDGERVLASERSYGTFRRRLYLGEGLDVDRVEASYDHGVLTLTIPVAEAAKPRRVPIATGNGSAPAIEAATPEAA